MRRKKNIEFETLAERKKRKELADRGKSEEAKVQEAMTAKRKSDSNYDFDRLMDSRAARAIVAAQVADYLIFYKGKSATVEVKHIKKGLRLKKASFPQHARMLRREQAGCKGFLITFTAEDGLWRVVPVSALEVDVPSWKLLGFTQFPTAANALNYVLTRV